MQELIKVLPKDYTALARAPPVIRMTRKWCLMCVKVNGHCLAFVDPRFQRDREVVMWAVRQDGYALRYADESLQDDRDVVLEAVNNCGAALYYASDTLKKDIDIATTALEREGDGAMPFVDARLRYGSDMKRAATRGTIGSPPPGYFATTQDFDPAFVAGEGDSRPVSRG